MKFPAAVPVQHPSRVACELLYLCGGRCPTQYVADLAAAIEKARADGIAAMVRACAEMGADINLIEAHGAASAIAGISDAASAANLRDLLSR